MGRKVQSIATSLFIAEVELPEIRVVPCEHPASARWLDDDEIKCRVCGRILLILNQEVESDD